MTPLERGGRTCALVIALSTCACGGRSPKDAPEPIRECVEYEKAVSACTGRETSVETQAAAAPPAAADRERLKKLCITNLRRIRDACR